MKLAITLLTAAVLYMPLFAQNQYEAIMHEFFDEEGSGGSAIVVKGDDVIYHGARGKANLELDVDMEVDHIFRIGSITKQFTAVAIMMLHEQGKLEVSDPITDYLPDYPVGEHTITIEHLLTHTSGIQSYTDMPGFMQNETATPLSVGDLINVFKNEPMNFNPGDEWRYNNSGYILLGAIIEAASGETYEDFIEGKIFEPLGMTSSYYDNNEEVVPMRAAGYAPGNEPGEIRNAQYLSMTLPYAAGSLMSTVGDLHKWNTAVMGGEVISEASMEKVFKGYVLNDGSDSGYGYGWQIAKISGLETYEHGGGIFGFLTQGIYVPSEDVYVAVLSNCNCIGPAPAARRMAALASGKSLEFKEIEVSEADLKEYIGVYAIDDTDEKRVVTVKDGVLQTQRGGGAVFPVKPYGKDKFFYDTRTTLRFERDSDGNITGQIVTTAAGDEGHATLTDEEVTTTRIVEVPLSVLERYVGVYELMPGFDITMKVSGNTLNAQATGQGAFDLEAYSDVKFGFPPAGIVVEFPADENPATQFTLNQGGQETVAKRKEE